MKVSVIVPSYNHRAYVEQTIHSVLSQSYKNLELIVVDDGSKDGSPEFLKKLSDEKKFHLILKENQGVCATLNRGISAATGDYITFIASDDLMTSQRIEEQVAFLEQHPQIDVVAGGVQLIDEQSQYLSLKKPKIQGLLSFDMIIRKNAVAAPTAMFRSQVFKKFGLYKENYLFEDYYMWLNILKNGGQIFNTDNIWAAYRLNETNFEKRFVWYYKGYLQILGDYLPDPRAVKMLEKYQLIFCAKMGLLLGSELFSKYKTESSSLGIHYQIILRLVGLCPKFLRMKILHFLLRFY